MPSRKDGPPVEMIDEPVPCPECGQEVARKEGRFVSHKRLVFMLEGPGGMRLVRCPMSGLRAPRKQGEA